MLPLSRDCDGLPHAAARQGVHAVGSARKSLTKCTRGSDRCVPKPAGKRKPPFSPSAPCDEQPSSRRYCAGSSYSQRLLQKRRPPEKSWEFAHADLGIPDRLSLTGSRPEMNMGHAELAEGGRLVVHAVAYHPGDRFECACPTARPTGCPACSGIRSLILFSLKTIALPRAEVSRLRARPKGFPIALWKPSGRPFDAMLLMQNSMTGRAECPPHPAI